MGLMDVTVVPLGDPYGDGRPPSWRFVDPEGTVYEVAAETEEEAVAAIDAAVNPAEQDSLEQRFADLVEKLVSNDVLTAEEAGPILDPGGPVKGASDIGTLGP